MPDRQVPLQGKESLINRTAKHYIIVVKHYDMSGFWVEFRNDIYNAEYLKSIGLNDRQIKAIQYLKKNGKITNSDYQQVNNCSRNTASNELAELVEKDLLKSSGQKRAGAYYTLNIHYDNCNIMSKNNCYILCKTGFEPEIVLSSVRTVIEEHKQLKTLNLELRTPNDYTITNTSWRILKLILGNAGLSNKWWGIE